MTATGTILDKSQWVRPHRSNSHGNMRFLSSYGCCPLAQWRAPPVSHSLHSGSKNPLAFSIWLLCLSPAQGYAQSLLTRLSAFFIIDRPTPSQGPLPSPVSSQAQLTRTPNNEGTFPLVIWCTCQLGEIKQRAY